VKPLPSETDQQFSAGDCAAMVLDAVPAVMRTIRCQMRGHTKPKLSVVQFRALSYLTRQPGAALSDVAEHIGMTLPSASKLVQAMLLRGYLSRKTSDGDRRKSVLTPTPAGLRLHRSARAATRKHLADLLNDVPLARRRAIVQAMGSLKEVFLEKACR
jgi:DNA-binding MarR family transcriptional regulator